MTIFSQPGLEQTSFTTAIPAAPVAPPAARKKHGWLPLLTVLFLISYGLMTMLIIEQGQTIESQRALIRELFRDSTELSAIKRAQAAKNATDAPKDRAAKAPVTQIPSTQTPSTQAQAAQIPSTQAPTQKTPSSQAAPQHPTQKQAQKQSQKPDFQMPSRPASDVADQERSLITI